MMIALDASSVAALNDFIEEIESLIDADDGTVFQIQHIDAVEEIKERLRSSPNYDEATVSRY